MKPHFRPEPSAVALTLLLASSPGCHRPRPPSQTAAHAQREADAPTDAGAEVPNNERWLTDAQVKATELATSVMQRGAAPSPIVFSGRIAFDDLQVAHVLPPVNGHVTEVLVAQGDHVRRGDALAYISSPDLGQVVADAESRHADLLAAERDLARNQALFADRAVAQKDLEAAKRRFAEAKAEFRRTREKSTQLGGHEGNTSDTYVVRAPIDGNVIMRNVTVGSDVQGQYENGPSAPELFTLGSLESVWVLADVFEMDVPHLHVGDAVAVSVVAFPGEVFAGTVDWIAPSVDAETRATRLRCRLENKGHRLKPEMFVTLQISVAGSEGVVVPISSVFYLGGKYFVYVQLPDRAKDGRLRFAQREVRVQQDAGGPHLAVLAGLEGGDTVVTRGGILLTPSQP